MNKNVKLIKTKPPRSDIKVNELLSALDSLGFEIREGKGSHLVIRHKIQTNLITIIPRPHGGNNCIKQPYIKKIQDLIEQIEE